jgi:hypothetical protein
MSTEVVTFKEGDRVGANWQCGPDRCFGKVTSVGGVMIEVTFLCHPDSYTRVAVIPAIDLEHID